MYERCPKCDQPTARSNGGLADHCGRCGLIYAKYLKSQLNPSVPTASRRSRARSASGSSPGGRMSDLLTRLRPLLNWDDRPVDPARFWGQVAIWLAFCAWGLRLIWLEMDSNAIGQSFMHVINLMFHEAGHAIFRPFGEFMTVLGGSLLQLIMPAVVVGAFLITNRDPFGASIGLWWFGQSLMDLAPYINDAGEMRLTLLGGGTGLDRPGMHDWNNLLGWTGLLEADHSIAWLADTAGEAIMLIAMFWGAEVLRQQHRRLS